MFLFVVVVASSRNAHSASSNFRAKCFISSFVADVIKPFLEESRFPLE